MRSAAAVLALAWLAGPLAAGESAGALRIPPARLAAAATYSREQGGEALIVRQFGRPLLESADRPGGLDRPRAILSITKTLAALATLAAAEDGLLTLDEPAARTLPEWRGAKARITIRDLLAQTSGLAPGYPALYSRRLRDKNRLALALPVAAAPGTRFDYGPVHYEVLEEILRRKLAPRRLDPLAYLGHRVLEPAGVRLGRWTRDPAGRAFFSAGAWLNARDLARIGEFLRTGRPAWLAPALSATSLHAAATGSAANPIYGLGLWLNARAPGATPLSIEGTLGADRPPAAWREACLSCAAPRDLVAMVGSGGLRCYVVPSRQLVVVRFGDGAHFSDAEFLRRLFAGP